MSNDPCLPSFPTVFWGETHAAFLPEGAALPPETPLRAALVFAIIEGKFLVADIAGRGWCIPGGHLHPGETPEQAVRRETMEETGATLGSLRRLGHYLLTETRTGATQLVPTYTAEVVRLDAIPIGTESRGVQILSLAELPQHYLTWDALMEALFAYALDCKES